jgi:hypothetical protein
MLAAPGDKPRGFLSYALPLWVLKIDTVDLAFLGHPWASPRAFLTPDDGHRRRLAKFQGLHSLGTALGFPRQAFFERDLPFLGLYFAGLSPALLLIFIAVSYIRLGKYS